jgi:hypothetical protein
MYLCELQLQEILFQPQPWHLPTNPAIDLVFLISSIAPIILSIEAQQLTVAIVYSMGQGEELYKQTSFYSV